MKIKDIIDSPLTVAANEGPGAFYIVKDSIINKKSIELDFRNYLEHNSTILTNLS